MQTQYNHRTGTFTMKCTYYEYRMFVHLVGESNTHRLTDMIHSDGLEMYQNMRDTLLDSNIPDSVNPLPFPRHENLHEYLYQY